MRRLNIELRGVGEMRWPDPATATCSVIEYTVLEQLMKSTSTEWD